MFLDIATIFVKAGNGGDGAITFHTAKYVANGGPDGGDGGKGGDVIFVAEDTSATLIDFRYAKHFRAEDGQKGGAKNCTGKSGKDMIIKVPCGTIIKDKKTNTILADMFYPGSEFVCEKGGKGGKGNARFATAQRRAPHFSHRGVTTKERELTLELKTIADVGLVGFPNVGKSTILSVVSGARPKIANYHFTTLNPNLGVAEYYDQRFVVADIPGLIEGASQGAGLGTRFLRHIERVRLIVHVVDISGSEGRDPYDDYVKINEELSSYSEKLGSLPQIVCANKCDLLTDDKNIEEFEKKSGKKVIRVSAATNSGLKDLLAEIARVLPTLPKTTPFEATYVEEDEEGGFEIEIADDGAYVVSGAIVNYLARIVVLSDYESFQYFQSRLQKLGVYDALREKGISDGDVVRILDIEFEYTE